MFEYGFFIFLGFAFLFFKCKSETRMKLLGRPLLLDITVSAVVLILHWGTFSGVMAAAIAGMLTSLFSSTLRWLIGYRDPNGTLYRGVLK